MLANKMNNIYGNFHAFKQVGKKFSLVFLCIFSLSLSSEEFPKILHFIWLGGVPYSENINTVNQWIAENADYNIIIWYSEEDLINRASKKQIRINNNSDFKAMLQSDYPSAHSVKKYFNDTFKGKNVSIKALESLWESLKQERETSLDQDSLHYVAPSDIQSLKEAFDMEALNPIPQARNLAAASDIARVLLLYYFGGIYFDFDVKAVNSYKLALAPSPFGFRMDIKGNQQCNNLLASIGHSKNIVNVVRKMASTYNEIILDHKEKKVYDDHDVLRYFNELQKYLEKCSKPGRSLYFTILTQKIDTRELPLIDGFCPGKITRLQYKKFGVIPVSVSPSEEGAKMGMSLKKVALTVEISGPAVFGELITNLKNEIQNSANFSIEDIAMPEEYFGINTTFINWSL